MNLWSISDGFGEKLVKFWTKNSYNYTQLMVNLVVDSSRRQNIFNVKMNTTSISDDQIYKTARHLGFNWDGLKHYEHSLLILQNADNRHRYRIAMDWSKFQMGQWQINQFFWIICFRAIETVNSRTNVSLWCEIYDACCKSIMAISWFYLFW